MKFMVFKKQIVKSYFFLETLLLLDFKEFIWCHSQCQVDLRIPIFLRFSHYFFNSPTTISDLERTIPETSFFILIDLFFKNSKKKIIKIFQIKSPIKLLEKLNLVIYL